MATWDKSKIFIRLLTDATGAPDVGAHVVKFQPIDQAYPTGAIDGTQCSTDESLYQPDTDLDTENHYDVYVDATRIGRLLSIDSTPSTGV